MTGARAAAKVNAINRGGSEMAKQLTSRRSLGRVAAAMVVSLAVVGCGAASAQAPRSAFNVPASFAAAPIEGSPEQTAIELGGATDTFRVAPIEGSPESTAIELGR
jgi:hypothetical protein